MKVNPLLVFILTEVLGEVSGVWLAVCPGAGSSEQALQTEPQEEMTGIRSC